MKNILSIFISALCIASIQGFLRPKAPKGEVSLKMAGSVIGARAQFMCPRGAKVIQITGRADLKSVNSIQFICSNNMASSVFGRPTGRQFGGNKVNQISNIYVTVDGKPPALASISYEDYNAGEQEKNVQVLAHECPMRGARVWYQAKIYGFEPIFSCDSSARPESESDLAGISKGQPMEFACPAGFITGFSGSWDGVGTINSISAACSDQPKSPVVGSNAGIPFNLPSVPTGLTGMTVYFSGTGVTGIGYGQKTVPTTPTGNFAQLKDNYNIGCPAVGFKAYVDGQKIAGIVLRFQCRQGAVSQFAGRGPVPNAASGAAQPQGVGAGLLGLF